MELYKKHRPTKLSELIGQDTAVGVLTDLGKKKRIPHFLLLTGGSGQGKTTLARILKTKLKCSDQDFTELNCADFRGVDMVRDIRRAITLAPLAGPCRIWLIDEAHQMTRVGQEACLKMLEDTPEHVHFIFATTDPAKLIKTIKTRATEINLRPLSDTDMRVLLDRVCVAEEKKFDDDVLNKIVRHAYGSPRKALVILNSIFDKQDVDEQLEAIEKGDSQAEGIQLARALLNTRSSWSDVAGILKIVEGEPESLRYLVLGYCSTVMLGGGKMAGRAYDIADAFRDNFFDTKKVGLVLSCWEVMHGEG